jgi:NAD-dependent dihydropyrimidine dehydrogenase PreA subunit
MAYVITPACTREATCVDVCPVDCIHPVPGERGYANAPQLFINPDECIDCGACETSCPVNAIYAESAVPRQWQQSIAINASVYQRRR